MSDAPNPLKPSDVTIGKDTDIRMEAGFGYVSVGIPAKTTGLMAGAIIWQTLHVSPVDARTIADRLRRFADLADNVMSAESKLAK